MMINIICCILLSPHIFHCYHQHTMTADSSTIAQILKLDNAQWLATLCTIPAMQISIHSIVFYNVHFTLPFEHAITSRSKYWDTDTDTRTSDIILIVHRTRLTYALITHVEVWLIFLIMAINVIKNNHSRALNTTNSELWRQVSSCNFWG